MLSSDSFHFVDGNRPKIVGLDDHLNRRSSDDSMSWGYMMPTLVIESLPFRTISIIGRFQSGSLSENTLGPVRQASNLIEERGLNVRRSASFFVATCK